MVAMIVHGDRRIAASEAVRKDLGLEDGVEYVIVSVDDGRARSGEPVPQPALPMSGARGSSDEQILELERVFGSLRGYVRGAGAGSMDDDWDETIGRAIVEDYLNEDYGEASERRQ